jgi:hypothetical protein
MNVKVGDIHSYHGPVKCYWTCPLEVECANPQTSRSWSRFAECETRVIPQLYNFMYDMKTQLRRLFVVLTCAMLLVHSQSKFSRTLALLFIDKIKIISSPTVLCARDWILISSNIWYQDRIWVRSILVPLWPHLKCLVPTWIILSRNWGSHGGDYEDSCLRRDNGGSKDLWNFVKLLPDYTALQPRRQPSSYE